MVRRRTASLDELTSRAAGLALASVAMWTDTTIDRGATHGSCLEDVTEAVLQFPPEALSGARDKVRAAAAVAEAAIDRALALQA